jgi:hypothetical protein
MVGRRREVAPINETGARSAIVDSAFGHTGSESGIVAATRALMLIELRAFRRDVVSLEGEAVGSHKPGASVALISRLVKVRVKE